MEHLQGLDVRYVVTGPGIEERAGTSTSATGTCSSSAAGCTVWRRGPRSSRHDDDQTALTEHLAGPPPWSSRRCRPGPPGRVRRRDPGRRCPDHRHRPRRPPRGPTGRRRAVRAADDAGALADAVVRIMIDPNSVRRWWPGGRAVADGRGGGHRRAVRPRRRGARRCWRHRPVRRPARPERSTPVRRSRAPARRRSRGGSPWRPASHRPRGACSTSAPTAPGRGRRRR